MLGDVLKNGLQVVTSQLGRVPRERGEDMAAIGRCGEAGGLLQIGQMLLAARVREDGNVHAIRHRSPEHGVGGHCEGVDAAASARERVQARKRHESARPPMKLRNQ